MSPDAARIPLVVPLGWRIRDILIHTSFPTPNSGVGGRRAQLAHCQFTGGWHLTQPHALEGHETVQHISRRMVQSRKKQRVWYEQQTDSERQGTLCTMLKLKGRVHQPASSLFLLHLALMRAGKSQVCFIPCHKPR